MKSFARLSQRQQNMLRYLQRYTREYGFPPSIREIGDNCNIGSTSVVNYNLKRLVEAGYIERLGRVSRGLRIIASIPGEPQPPSTSEGDAQLVPLLGRIAAGEPIPLPEDIAHHIDQDDYIAVPSKLLGNSAPHELFALTVRGDSMVDSMINDGDIIILRRQQTAENGDMVAAWLPQENETTLKHFYHEGRRIRLQPANSDYEPLLVPASNCEIKGKVLSVMRSFH